MDTSITLVTPAMNCQRGADAFDRGLSINDHGMNPWAPAVADWKRGWMQRQATVRANKMAKLAGLTVSPP